MTLDELAHAMRGMPCSAPMLVATADGLCPIVKVRSCRPNGGDSPGHDDDAAVYAIVLELDELISRRQDKRERAGQMDWILIDIASGIGLTLAPLGVLGLLWALPVLLGRRLYRAR